jgi:uncharacterized membrane protein YfcA
MKHISLFPIVHYWAHFQGVEEHISITGLAGLGVFIGILTGFFGVGGRFILAPLLNIFFGVPYNVVAGSEVCQMLGNSSMSMSRLGRTGNIDGKLALLLSAGAVIGVEAGVQLLQLLKTAGHISLFGRQVGAMVLAFSVLYAALLVLIGTTVYRESVALSRNEAAGPSAVLQRDLPARLQTFSFPPFISLPGSGIGRVSLWVVLGVGFFIGLLVGFMGVGGTFVGLPALVYVLGCPIAVAYSTDLLEGLIVTTYGVFSHSMKGNVDLGLAVTLFVCLTVGARVALPFAARSGVTKVRKAFAVAAYLVAFFLLIKLVGIVGVVKVIGF